jgi:membrane-associated phospholipid phosphatase
VSRVPQPRLIAACTAVGLTLLLLIGWVDQPVARAMAGLPEPIVASFQFVTWFGKPGWALVPLALMFVVAWGWRARLVARGVSKQNTALPQLVYTQRAIIFIVFSMAGAGLIVNILKPLIGRTRPSELIAQGQHFFAWFRLSDTWINSTLNSFPSGHATSIVSLAVALGFVFPKSRVWFWLAAIPVALSRPVVGAHYLSDVLAGAMVAVLWTTWLSRRPWFGLHSCSNTTSKPFIKE